MVIKCDICNKNYVEEGEIMCVACAVSESLDIEAAENYFIEEGVGYVDEEVLNDDGVSVFRVT